MDRIFHGGIVHTMAGTTAQAVAVKNGSIAAVGSDSDLMAMAGPGTETGDLGGACLLPGFTDSHCHLVTVSCDYSLDLRGVASAEELVERGRSFLAAENPPEGAWVRLAGFNESSFKVPALPDRHLLDRISTRHPLVATRICTHVGAANTLGLERCGFGPATAIEGGALDREAGGGLSGVLRENALYACMAQVPPCSEERLRRSLAEAMAARSATGITTVHSNDTDGAGFDGLRRVFAGLRQEGRQSLRVYQQVTADSMESLERTIHQAGRERDDWFFLGCVKLFADGSLGGRTAAMRSDYRGAPGERGILIHSDDGLAGLVQAAHRAGFQAAVHAIGDGALEQCVAAVEAARADGNHSLRHRVVHCQFGDEALYRRMKQAGLAADIQPAFLPTDRPIIEPLVGEERASESYAWKTLLDLGIIVAGGSDSPVEPFDPLWGIYCAVTRQDGAGQPPGGWHPQQRLTVEQAVRIYTSGGPQAAHMEDRLGTVEPGKLADFVVLDKDILATEPEGLLDIKVAMTVVDGEIRYDART